MRTLEMGTGNSYAFLGDPLPAPPYRGFMPSPDEHPLPRSRDRDQHVRTVSRATRAIAALAVLGTATFGALAAASTRASSSATAAGTAATPAATERDHRILVVLTVLGREREPGGARGRPGHVGAGAGRVLRRLLT